ncbi:MAG: hypothetical protein IJV77_00265 [Clostridia bacterium]|nr:hypothetical protein [Clostridia bacterium]
MNILFCCVSVVGCVLGIGFLTGKELTLFFGNANALAVSVCFFFLFFAICFLFLRLGKKYLCDDVTSLNDRLFDKGAKAFSFVFVLTCFLVCAVMMAGVQSLWSGVTGKNFCFSLLLALFCVLSLSFGVGAVKKVGFALVPLVVVLFFVVLLPAFDGFANKGFCFADFVRVAKYVCFNCMLGASVFLSCGKTLCKGHALVVALCSSLVLSAMIFLVLSTGGGDMPVLDVAKNSGVYLLFVLALTGGVATALCCCSYTVVEWLDKKTCDKKLSVAVVCMCAYVTSLFGFGKMLGFVLPVSSTFALVFVFCAISKVLKKDNV